MNRYALPKCLDETLTLLAKERWAVVAGGTDFYPLQGDSPVTGSIMDIHHVDSLRFIREEDSGWRIGALATWTDIIGAKLPRAFDGLKLAAREIGSVQIQNAATLAGNLCNASPAADGVPPLLTLNAELELSSVDGKRLLPLGEFLVGSRITLLAPNELVTAIVIPRVSERSRSHFIKLGSRKYLVISIAMVSALIQLSSEQKIRMARIAVGSCSAVAQRLHDLERQLLGKDASVNLDEFLQTAHVANLSPIDDIRASGEFRLSAALELVRRVLQRCLVESQS